MTLVANRWSRCAKWASFAVNLDRARADVRACRNRPRLDGSRNSANPASCSAFKDSSTPPDYRVAASDLSSESCPDRRSGSSLPCWTAYAEAARTWIPAWSAKTHGHQPR